MKLVFTARFDRSLAEAPAVVKSAFWKQANFLLQDLQHPSLRAKKYDARNDVWLAALF
jgi:hypothetical protein